MLIDISNKKIIKNKLLKSIEILISSSYCYCYLKKTQRKKTRFINFIKKNI